MAANVSLTIGVIGGVKFADYLAWDEHKYSVMKEQLEMDYWKKYGKPEYIEGNLHKSSIKEGEFYITYLKEKNPHESMEKRVYKVIWLYLLNPFNFIKLGTQIVVFSKTFLDLLSNALLLL